MSATSPRTPFSQQFRQGQALAELVILLIVVITLIVGVTTLTRLCLQQELLHRDIRVAAGESALHRQTVGWADPTPLPEHRSNTFHRINAYTYLNEYTPALTSRLPMSNYTLSARVLPEGDLGLEETELRKTILLDEAFIRFIYGKGSMTFGERLTFPSTTGIWQ